LVSKRCRVLARGKKEVWHDVRERAHCRVDTFGPFRKRRRV
jgi:hypothetical protein